ncbi:OmpA family protein [Sulfurimonas sp. HSL-1716]|uniref:OmpA family protein n=1 Tax=Hydrocurvibacter sulfurireducens TaxID=3131937 RepID=UPI0031F928B3
MKKLFAIPVLLTSALLLAQQYDYEVTPLIGYNIAEGNLNLKNHAVLGGEFQLNNIGMPVSPELSILYSNADFDPNYGSTNIYRIALNGVYEYEKTSLLTPFVKAGLGYETMSEHKTSLTHNDDSGFADVGVGAKIPFTDHISLKLEAVYMLKANDNRWDNNLALLAGVNIAFGQTRAQQHQENIVVEDSAEKAHKTAQEKAAKEKAEAERKAAQEKAEAEAAALANADDDNDGVKNSLDKCPNTPKEVTVVDAEGCMKEVNLHINFDNASYDIDEPSQKNIQKFVDFLNAAPVYKAEIIGYTDSIGKKTDNLKLSLKRAEAVKSMLEKKGVSSERIKAVGMGEENPVADNATAKGRAQNRRIEAKLIK